MENENVIRQQMEDTRTSLTEKLETLEQKVLDTVQGTTSAINETVCNVKESVSEGVESVKDFMDVSAQVDRHPWLMVGGSVLCGFLIGSMLPSAKAPAQYTPSTPRRQRTEGNGHHKTPAAAQQPLAPKKEEAPSMAEQWLSDMQPELGRLKSLALGAVLGTVREMITKETPPYMGEQLHQIIDGLTRKIGGDVVPSSDWENFSLTSTSATSGEPVDESARQPEGHRPRW